MDAAWTLLRAAAGRGPEGEVAGHMQQLALAVLGERLPALALRVLEGGPHALDRAIELAEGVIRDRRSTQDQQETSDPSATRDAHKA